MAQVRPQNAHCADDYVDSEIDIFPDENLSLPRGSSSFESGIGSLFFRAQESGAIQVDRPDPVI